MPNTLIPIQTVTVGVGGASSIDFTNIPQNYTDLALKISGRVSYAATAVGIQFGFNGQAAGTSITGKTIQGSGSAASTYSAWQPNINGASATSNTFGSVEIYIPNYTSSANKSISSESVQEDNSSTAYAELHSALWSNTSVITRITITPNSGSFVQNSTATLYGISNGVKATGGTLTVAGGYAYHTFTSTGSFLPNQQIKGAEVLLVAGGGAGGTNYGGGGGGGAGGVFYANNQTLNAGNSYTALVGAGSSTQGAVNTPSTSGNGSNSVFSSLTALGGGGGASYNATPGSGGSGGGAGGGDTATTGGSGTVGQGNNGGSNPTIIQYAGAGGGGAGAAGGSNSAGPTGGKGGDGTSAYTTWHSVTGTGVLSGGVYYIAGGGGGGAGGPSSPFSGTGGAAGLGGGSAGVSGSSNASNATANTGGGGGGIRQGTVSGNGGSGLIIVRYPLS